MSNQPTSSDSNVRNIFIAGNTGREEIIANHVGGSEEGISYRVKMINILSEEMHDQAANYPTDDNSDESLSKVHLLLFVLDSGRYTTGEKRAFDNIFQEHLKPCASTISALVLTGCENKDTDARKRIVEEFRTAFPTKHIAKFMGRGIHAFGFLDLSETIEKFRASFLEEMKAGSKTLRDMARNQDNPIAVTNVFQNKTGKGPAAVVKPGKEDTPSPSNAELQARLQKLEERFEEEVKNTATLRAEFQSYKPHFQPAQQTKSAGIHDGALVPTTAGTHGALVPTTAGIHGALVPTTAGIHGALVPTTTGIHGALVPMTAGIHGALVPTTAGIHGALVPTTAGIHGAVVPMTAGIHGAEVPTTAGSVATTTARSVATTTAGSVATTTALDAYPEGGDLRAQKVHPDSQRGPCSIY